jgi:spermidine synthase
MTLGWSATDAAMRQYSVETIRARAEQAGILGATQYWTPEIHVGAFNLPPYIGKHLPK